MSSLSENGVQLVHGVRDGGGGHGTRRRIESGIDGEHWDSDHNRQLRKRNGEREGEIRIEFVLIKSFRKRRISFLFSKSMRVLQFERRERGRDFLYFG